MEEKVIRPFYHRHPLVLKEKVASGTNRATSCYGCVKPVTDSEMVYICIYCKNMILHKKCGELPSEINQHPKHPHHPIHLYDYHDQMNYRCDVCRRDLNNRLGYRCNSCNVDIDIACEKIGIDAFSEEKRKELLHPSHPLTLIRKPPFSFYCDGCGAEGADMAYICTSCEVMLHKSCAALPANVPTVQHHHHLSLAFSFPKKHRKFRYKCEFCDKLLDLTCWVYYCGDCRYFVHIKCVVAAGLSTSNFPESSDLNGEGDGDAIEFPLHANDISDKLITPFVMRQTGLDLIPDSAGTSNSTFIFEYHHEHPLRLVSEFIHKAQVQDEDEDEDEDEKTKICDVCITPIPSSTPYYECAVNDACTYSIHSICSSLPHTLQYPSSSASHLLKLYGDCQNLPNNNHNFTICKSKGFFCGLCGLSSIGMGYKCGDCRKMIDVKCASLPTTIRHAFHTRRHHKPLTLTRASTKKQYCHVCNESFDDVDKIGYCCSHDSCDFALDIKCAMLPSSVTNREWDKHLLLLTSDASRDHPSDFYCELCETEMHPKEWMYHCRQCDASFHLKCLETSSYYRNVKLGRPYEMDRIHPDHPLIFTWITLKKHCDLCRKKDYVYTWLGFECASCYYVVCESCGNRELSWKEKEKGKKMKK